MLKVIGASLLQTRVSTSIVGAVFALGVLAIILGEIDQEVDDGIYSATVYWHKEAGFHIDFWGQGNELEEIPYGVGRAYYKQDIDTTGWAVLEAETRPEYPDWVQAYAAGLLEGSLTWQLIYWHWLNTVNDVCSDCKEFCNQVRNFIEENSEWIKDKAEERGDKDPFWHQVNLFYVQLDGLEMGWRHGVKRSRQDIDIPHADFLLMNVVSDLPDMELYYNNTIEHLKIPFIFTTASGFASAFVKFQQDTGELYAAHNSGGLYQSMLRMLKRYQFGYHSTSASTSGLVPGQTVSFSSYPGVLHSQDDFYLVTGDPEFGKKQHQLAVLGTALNVQNRSYITKLQSEEHVLIGARVMAANRIAQDGRFWARYLARANSGTGSKQWLIVDYGQIANTEWRRANITTNTTSTEMPPFSTNTPSPASSTNTSAKQRPAVVIKERKGLLWVVEQLPGYMHSADQTVSLTHRGSWISSGEPSYQNKSQPHGQENKFHPIQKNLSDVSNLTSVLQLMRNNSFNRKYLVSPKSKSNPSFSGLPAPMGTIDTKVFVASPFQNVELYVVSSALNFYSNEKQNVSRAENKTVQMLFQWSKSQFANETHVGLPDLLHFDVVRPQWVWF